MFTRLENKVVIITGGSSGIGAATARLLAGQGCKLALVALPDDRLQPIADELGALAIPADVTRADDVQNMVDQTLAHYGRIDALYANAGIFFTGHIKDADPEAWVRMVDINVNGVMRCAIAVSPHMIAQGSGDIIITTSISGLIDIHGEPVYSASKHAVQGLTHTLRRQLAPHGVRVGAVAPGIIANDLTGIKDPAEIDRLSYEEHRYLRSEDVARAVAFMLSRPSHVTLRNLVILPQNQDI